MIFARLAFFSFTLRTLVSAGKTHDALVKVYWFKHYGFRVVFAPASWAARVVAQQLVVAELADLVLGGVESSLTWRPHWHGLKFWSERSSGSAQTMQSGSSWGQ